MSKALQDEILRRWIAIGGSEGGGLGDRGVDGRDEEAKGRE